MEDGVRQPSLGTSLSVSALLNAQMGSSPLDPTSSAHALESWRPPEAVQGR